MYRRHFKSAAKGRLHHGNRHAGVNGLAIALEKFMFLNMKDDIQIARRPAFLAALAFARHPHTGAVIDAGWNIDRQFDLFPDQSFAAAILAGIGDDLPFATAVRAGRADLKKSLGADNLPRP
jgi:hypothetical protein